MMPVANRDDVRREHYQRFYRSFYVPKLRALMRGKDVVHSFADSYLGWAAEEAARAESVPFLLTPYVHPGDVHEAADNVAFLRRADVVFALLETDKQRLIEFGVPPERTRLQGVVPLLPETSDARAFRAAHGLDDKPIVLFVGRMTEHKGPLVILNAAPLVWRELPDVHFLFAGPGGKQQVRWFLERADDRIRYLGQIDEQQKGDALAACDLFCMPSIMEILPAVYLEAWSYGKAVVGGTAHGLRELIEGNGAGIVVEQDPDILAKWLVELLRDEPRRREMGERGRALVERRYTPSSLVRALEEAYIEVVAAKQARPVRDYL
jgi:glycosyltransferase involved in cell wall biosynthesis